MNEQQTQVLTGTQTGSRIVIDLAAENPFTQFFCGDGHVTEPMLQVVINSIRDAIVDLTVIRESMDTNMQPRQDRAVRRLAGGLSLLEITQRDIKQLTEGR